MSNPIQPNGSTVVISTPGDTTSAVANVATSTNTFYFLNTSAANVAFVGVFNSYTAASSMGLLDGGIPVLPASTVTVKGNFGINPNPGTVYVAATTEDTVALIAATPITP